MDFNFNFNFNLPCTALGLFLENLIHRILSIDSDYCSLLKLIQHQSLSVEITDFPKFKLSLTPTEKKVKLSLHEHTPRASAEISGELLKLFNFAVADKTTALSMMSSKEILIKGDIEVLENYQKFFSSLDLDWSTYLSQSIGPTAAGVIAKQAQKTKLFHQKNFEQVKSDLAEFITEEIQITPHSHAVENFYTELRIFKFNLDRLEAKLNNFKKNKK